MVGNGWRCGKCATPLLSESNRTNLGAFITPHVSVSFLSVGGEKLK